MLRSLILFISLLYLLCTGGCGQAVDTPLTDWERILSLQVDTIKLDYENGSLRSALNRAQRTHSIVQQQDTIVDRLLRLELYQHLAMLHFQRWPYNDSAVWYTDAAAPLLLEQDEIIVHARQVLCEAYSAYTGHAVMELQLLAHLGQAMLTEASKADDLMNAWFLLIEGRGRKQQAYGTEDTVQKAKLFHQAELLMRRALYLFESKDVKWRYHALDHIGIVYARQPKHDERLERLLDSLPKYDGKLAFGYPDRLRGYWHYHRDRPDSAAYYYDKVLRDSGYYVNQIFSEAKHIYSRYAISIDDFDRALELERREVVEEACCPDTESQMFDCYERPSCLYYQSAFPTIYLERFRLLGDTSDLYLSQRHASASLTHYEGLFSLSPEDAVLGLGSFQGPRFIDAALQTNADLLTINPSERWYQDIFRAMETGKTYLLLQDIYDRSEFSEEMTAPGSESLSLLKTEVRLYLQQFSAKGRVPLNDLRRFRSARRQIREIRKIIAAEDSAISSRNEAPAIPTLSNVRHKLLPGQALFEFAETAEELFLLYLDRDTVALHRVPLDTIQPYIDDYLTALHQGRQTPVSEYASSAFRLYQTLFGSLYKMVARQTDLLIIPSPLLNRVPFPSLVVEEVTNPNDYTDLSYLIDGHTIRHLESWRSYEQNMPVSAGSVQSKNAGVWTNPSLANYLGSLATGPIASAMSSVIHYSQTNCSTRSFLADAADFDWIHISAHARGNPERLNENYIHLAANDSLNGLLIGRQRLRARTVVLAACATSQGYSDSPEGTLSLRRSFHRAGVPTVIASLYDIPASATQELLSVFYLRMAAGDDEISALATAQRELREGQSGQKYVYPRFWAGISGG